MSGWLVRRLALGAAGAAAGRGLPRVAWRGVRCVAVCARGVGREGQREGWHGQAGGGPRTEPSNDVLRPIRRGREARMTPGPGPACKLPTLGPLGASGRPLLLEAERAPSACGQGRKVVRFLANGRLAGCTGHHEQPIWPSRPCAPTRVAAHGLRLAPCAPLAPARRSVYGRRCGPATGARGEVPRVSEPRARVRATLGHGEGAPGRELARLRVANASLVVTEYQDLPRSTSCGSVCAITSAHR